VRQSRTVEPSVVTTHMPMNTPIVVDGTALCIEEAGRFSLRARTLSGHACGIAPDAPYRPLTTRDEALRVLERLISRVFDRPLPTLPDGLLVHEVRAALAQLPLDATLDLHGRALFAPATLEPANRERSEWARDAFFEELGRVLGVPGRTVLARARARKLELRPPRAMPAGYDYLDTFTTDGKLTAADPCYVGKKNPAGFPLTVKVDARDGVWHVFARSAPTTDGSRTAELVTLHDDGFGTYANECIGSIAVDTGTAGVFDSKCPRRRDTEVWLEEGTVHGLGAVTQAGHGDGMYPVFAGSLAGKVVKLRIHYIGDGAVDRSVAAPASPAKPYKPTTKFALGDTIEHSKFGVGSVTRVSGDGKVDVSFPDGLRTLVHAKK
jgi:hypothetical protein